MIQYVLLWFIVQNLNFIYNKNPPAVCILTSIVCSKAKQSQSLLRQQDTVRGDIYKMNKCNTFNNHTVTLSTLKSIVQVTDSVVKLEKI